MPFDARAAKLLQPGEHIILPEHPGLRLQATTSRRSWIYRFKSPVDGGMRQVKLGEWPAVSLGEAVGAWAALRRGRDAGQDPALQKRDQRRQARAAKAAAGEGGYTVGQLVQDYLAGHVDVRRQPKGRKEVRRLLERHAVGIQDRPVHLLQRAEAYKVIEAMRDTPVLAAQVRQEMGAAWDYGLDAGKIPDSTPNWWRQIMRGKLRSKGKTIDGERVGPVKRVLTESEVGQLINWLPNFSPLVEDVLTLYLWTGTRGAEIVGMVRAELVEEGGVLWWTIPKERTKNMHREAATDLRVPLIGRAANVVRRRLAKPGELMFPAAVKGSPRPTEQKQIQSAVYFFQPYCKLRPTWVRARLPVVRWAPHDLRRTVRTLLASMGCPAEVAESVLGHMLPGVVGVYNRHSYDRERVEWLTRLDAKLEELARRHPAPAAVAA